MEDLGLVARDGGTPLRKARTRAGLTMSELARRAGIAVHRVSRVEGVYGSRVEGREAEAIASVLSAALEVEIDVEDLFGGDVDPALVGTRSQKPTPPQQRYSGASGKKAVGEAEAYCAVRGLVWQREAARSVLKLEEPTLVRYVDEGLIRPRERRVFNGLEFVLFDRRELEKFSRWLKDEWRANRHLPRRPTATFKSTRSRAWKNRVNGLKGGEYGHLGGRLGIEPGRDKGGRKPIGFTPEQQVQIISLDRDGLTPRQIAEKVLGDKRLHGRVRRHLRR